MITTRRINEYDTVIVCYVKDNDDKPQPFYLHDEFKPELTMMNRNNLGDYINMALFRSSGRYPVSEKIINAVYYAIVNGKKLTVDNCQADVYQYYENAMSYINRNLPTCFIAEKGARFYVSPTLKKNQRDFIIATGPAGVGKSWLAADFCNTYRFHWPDRPIYLISAKDKDEAFDTYKGIKRIKVEELKEFIGWLPDDEEKDKKKKEKEKEKLEKDRVRAAKKQKITIEELRDDQLMIEGPPSEEKKANDYNQCLFVFDDIEHIKPEELKKRVYDFKAYLTQVKRSSEVDIFLCNHMHMNYRETRDELNECTAVVLYPRAGTVYHMKNYLTKYLALDNDQINRIIDAKHRWVMVYKNHPITVVTENEIWIIKKD